jgi:hypothetical protein
MAECPTLRDWLAMHAGKIAGAYCDELGRHTLEQLVGIHRPEEQDDPIGYARWRATADAVCRYLSADAMLFARRLDLSSLTRHDGTSNFPRTVFPPDPKPEV